MAGVDDDVAAADAGGAGCPNTNCLYICCTTDNDNAASIAR